jgi:transcriptional regulator with XRE-family HTH domain
MNDLIAVGSRIKILRQTRKLTQEQLAEMIEIDPKSLGRLERGDHMPSLETLSRIAATLKASIHDFFPESEFAPIDPTNIEEIRRRLIDIIYYSADETTLLRWYREGTRKKSKT